MYPSQDPPLKGGDQQLRVTAFMDRGTIKFRIRRNGKVIGWLTIDGLVRWYEMQKPTPSGHVVGFPEKSL